MVILRSHYGAVIPPPDDDEDMERLVPPPFSSSSSSSWMDESIEEDNETSSNNSTTIKSSVVWLGVVVMAFLGVFAIISVAALQFSSSSSYFSTTKSNFVSKSFERVPYASTTSGLSVATVWNEYGEFGANGMLSYPFLSGSFLIEPYKLTTINIQGIVVGCTYSYTITSMGTTDDTNISGTVDTTGVLQVTLTKVGKYMLQVEDSCNAAEPLSQTVWVKYVRRELSTLTDTDREEFLDAFHTLWEVNTVDGMAKYGERYKSLYYFAALHNDGGGNSVCDEFHGGVGFLNNHMYLSAYLEQSMQLVNPKVCLHYMEYTKYFTSDGFQKHLTNELDGGGWTELLGANDPISGRITDGRWAMTPIPYLTTEFFTNHGIDGDKTFFPSEEKVWTTLTNPHLNSPYGLLRSPWNYNPDPYVTRFGNVWRVPDTSVITCTCAKVCDPIANPSPNSNPNFYLLTFSCTKVRMQRTRSSLQVPFRCSM